MKNHSAVLNAILNPAVSENLKIHENQDQSEKPFSCTQCAFKFTNSAEKIQYRDVPILWPANFVEHK